MELEDSVFSAVNLACGGKICVLEGWLNCDHSPSSNYVRKIDLLKPLPFTDNTFDVVYHSQFIEHLSEEAAELFLAECFRILKTGGVMRVVTPDLQNQAEEYLKQLAVVRENPSDTSRLRYDWIKLELLDQLSRNRSGGAMIDFLAGHGNNIRPYLVERLGRSGSELISPNENSVNKRSLKQILTPLYWLKKCCAKLFPKITVGRFRLSGEAHLIMYDEFSLRDSLTKAGFSQVERVSFGVSRIDNWQETCLDNGPDGVPDCPTSLFMEARK